MPQRPPIHRPIPPAPRAADLRPSSRDRGYDYQWEQVRDIYLSAHRLCEDCLLVGRTCAGTEVHHVLPLARGGEPYALENLRTLCHACHMQTERALEAMHRDEG